MIPDSPSSGLVVKVMRTDAGRAIVVLAMLTGLASLGGCHKSPLFAPSGSTITISSNSLILPLNGTATITATVTQTGGGAVLNGTTVTFTTTLGSFTQSEVETSSGRAVVTFNAGAQSGTAVITAYSGGTSSGGGGGTGTTGSISIVIGAAALSNILVTASPSSVSQLGNMPSTITATAVDASNNPIGGILINFSTDQGSLSSVSATTNAAGQATTTLTTNQTATVTATAGTKSGTVKVTAVPVPTVTLSAPSTSPTALVAATFTLNVSPGSGASPIRDVTMDFGDGATVDLGSVSGQLSVQHVYAAAGTYTVKATATDAAGQSATAGIPVVVYAAIPFTVSVSTSSSTAVAGSTVVLFTATPNAGAPSITSYTWNFNDGTAQDTTTLPFDSHVFPVTAVVGTSSTFVVTVTATGSDGRVGYGSVVITVTK